MSGETQKTIDQRWAGQVTPELTDAVNAAATEGRITCAVLRKLAESFGVAYEVAGASADIEGIKVKSCDLGCF